MATLKILVFCISVFMVFAEEPVTGRVNTSTEGAEDVSGVDLHSEDLVAIGTDLYDVGQHYGDQEDQDDRYSHHSSSASRNSHGDHDKYKKYDGSHGNRNKKSGESKYGNHGNQDHQDDEKGIRDYGHTKKGFHNLYHKEEVRNIYKENILKDGFIRHVEKRNLEAFSGVGNNNKMVPFV